MHWLNYTVIDDYVWSVYWYSNWRNLTHLGWGCWQEEDGHQLLWNLKSSKQFHSCSIHWDTWPYNSPYNLADVCMQTLSENITISRKYHWNSYDGL